MFRCELQRVRVVCSPPESQFFSYDFSDATMQQRWTARVTDAAATGYVDGAAFALSLFRTRIIACF